MAPKVRKRKPAIVKEFIEIVHEELTRQDMSVTELARRADVARPYLHRVLAGEQAPSLEWAQRILAVLGVGMTFEKTPV